MLQSSKGDERMASYTSIKSANAQCAELPALTKHRLLQAEDVQLPSVFQQASFCPSLLEQFAQLGSKAYCAKYTLCRFLHSCGRVYLNSTSPDVKHEFSSTSITSVYKYLHHVVRTNIYNRPHPILCVLVIVFH
jgi:hypothetical protein